MSDQPSQDVEQPLVQVLEGIPIARPVALPAGDLLPPAVPRPPRVWTVWAICVIVLVTMILANTVLLVGAGIFRRQGPATPEAILEDFAGRPVLMIGSAFVSLIVALAVTLLAAFLSPVQWRQRLRLRVPAMSAEQIVLGAIGAVAIGLMFTMANTLGLLPRSTTLELIGRAMSAFHGMKLIPVLLVIGLMPGLAEEFLFRGYIQTRLTQRWGTCWSVLITAVLFGAYHMDLSQGMLAVAIGVYLGALVERANSIVPAMIGHGANNTVGVLVSAATGEIENARVGTCLLIAGAVILAFCLYRIFRATPRAVTTPPQAS